MNVEKLAKAIADARDKAFAESSAGKTANQMQELCRDLVGALKCCLAAWKDGYAPHEDPGTLSEVQSALDKAEHAFNPTPSAQGCVETAATVSACVGTGETDKALGVGSVEDKCEVCGSPRHKEAWRGFTCYSGDNVEICGWAEVLAITRAKQLAAALDCIGIIKEAGDIEGGTWCAEQARSFLHDLAKGLHS